MNSGDRNLVLGLALAALAMLATACSDRGPTNLYSKQLFGAAQGEPNLVVWRVNETSLSSTAFIDGFEIYLKNIGTGGTFGPVRATLASLSTCAVPMTYGLPAATAVFGEQGKEIAPGQIIRGFAVDSWGIQQTRFGYDVTFTCPGTNVDFTVTATDPYGKSWSSNFTGQAF
jgi:hypothetical protein